MGYKKALFPILTEADLCWIQSTAFYRLRSSALIINSHILYTITFYTACPIFNVSSLGLGHKVALELA